MSARAQSARAGGAPTPKDKLLSTVGLCARARKLITGTSMVCEALRKGAEAGDGKRPLAVLEASDTSAGTHKKLASKCAYYRTPLHRLPVNTAELGHAIGKSGLISAVAVTDEHLLRALAPHLPAPEAPPADIPPADAQDGDE